MSIKILKSGLFSTIQDLGRFGFQDQGFSIAGAMDEYAFTLGQKLIGNEGPAIECTLIGPTIEFMSDNTIVITGGCFDAKLNDVKIAHQTVVAVKKGDVLSCNQVLRGARGYILFGRPLAISQIAGSYSTHTRSNIGGYKGRKLKNNDVINTKQCNRYQERIGYCYADEIVNYDATTIHIVEGPQFEAFSSTAITDLVSTEFTTSENADRMGYRLNGTTIQPQQSADIISEPVALGSIQVPNDGNPIILLNDKQTVGGYTKIANVCQSDLSILAHKKPGDKLNFQWISIKEATDKLIEQKQKFAEILTSIDEQPQFDLTQMRRTATKINTLLKGEL
ncbi:biotin-dependent carboxyltransferase family protein [Staphylococcus arlettae]|uniref:5-oxoprolinase subunit C family protein n=1 Tax=Staphylococcus arlettae TaxID=29378 RepID=UPI001E560072|nr:biotin-dependent carboxyltransferase family protein [Staphylococcus arlettae]MCD8862952.1 biotin-dependent carboxyltransferase family protein [Staphylococcus arlettae]